MAAVATAPTGYTHDELVGQQLSFLFGEQSELQHTAQLHTALSTLSSVRLVVVSYKNDGSCFPNLLSVSPFTDPLTGVHDVNLAAKAVITTNCL